MKLPKYVALLRGINLAGRNRVAMKGLAEIFTTLGCTDVTTFIQSGNVIFKAPKPVLKTLPTLAKAQIAEAFGCRVPVILRSAEELDRVMAENPYLQAGEPEKTLYHCFFSRRARRGRSVSTRPQPIPPRPVSYLGA